MYYSFHFLYLDLNMHTDAIIDYHQICGECIYMSIQLDQKLTFIQGSKTIAVYRYSCTENILLLSTSIEYNKINC